MQAAQLPLVACSPQPGCAYCGSHWLPSARRRPWTANLDCRVTWAAHARETWRFLPWLCLCLRARDVRKACLVAVAHDAPSGMLTRLAICLQATAMEEMTVASSLSTLPDASSCCEPKNAVRCRSGGCRAAPFHTSHRVTAAGIDLI